MKCSMLSDGLVIFLYMLGLERGYAFAPWMGGAPPETLAAVERWKSRGEWDPNVDREPYDGTNSTAHLFRGFEGAFPFYLDITYSHSLQYMAIAGAFIGVVWAVLGSGRGAVGRGGALAGAAVLFLCTVSHPALDMVYHDAYILSGNRTLTRVAFLDGGLWQNARLSAVGFILELCLAILPYMIWRASRAPADGSAETGVEIQRDHRLFWALALGFNLASLYLLAPGMQYVAWPVGYR